MSSERSNSNLKNLLKQQGTVVFSKHYSNMCKQCFSLGTIFSSGLIHDLCPSERDKYMWDWLKLNLNAYVRDSERVCAMICASFCANLCFDVKWSVESVWLVYKLSVWWQYTYKCIFSLFELIRTATYVCKASEGVFSGTASCWCCCGPSWYCSPACCSDSSDSPDRRLWQRRCCRCTCRPCSACLRSAESQWTDAQTAHVHISPSAQNLSEEIKQW